jgi:hypothetical protein
MEVALGELRFRVGSFGMIRLSDLVRSTPTDLASPPIIEEPA